MTAEGLDALLAAAAVDPAVHELRPDYVALLVAADGLPGGPSDEASDGWLREAEAAAAGRLAGSPPEERPHVALWREAFRAFGAKPQRTRNSLEALLRRVPDGLPRINRLTDLYNAVSVLHEVPVGGEDLDAVCRPRPPDPRDRDRAVRDDGGRPAGRRAPRARRGRLGRRRRGHLPTVELAPVHAHPAHPGDQPSAVHHRRPRSRCPRDGDRRRR